MPVTTVQITPNNWENETPELILSMMFAIAPGAPHADIGEEFELLELGIVQAIALVLFALQAAGEKQ